MGKIWLKSLDPNKQCCGCEGKTGPCDSCACSQNISASVSKESAAQWFKDNTWFCKVVQTDRGGVSYPEYEGVSTSSVSFASFDNNILKFNFSCFASNVANVIPGALFSYRGPFFSLAFQSKEGASITSVVKGISSVQFQNKFGPLSTEFSCSTINGAVFGDGNGSDSISSSDTKVFEPSENQFDFGMTCGITIYNVMDYSQGNSLSINCSYIIDFGKATVCNLRLVYTDDSGENTTYINCQ